MSNSDNTDKSGLLGFVLIWPAAIIGFIGLATELLLLQQIAMAMFLVISIDLMIFMLKDVGVIK